MDNKISENNKAKDFKKALKDLFTHMKPLMPLLILSVVFAIIGSVLSIIGPNKLKDLTNIITEGFMTSIDMNKVKHIGIILIIMYGFSFIFNYLQSYIMATITNKFSKNLRNDLSKKINNLPLKYYDGTTVGDTLSRITNDVDTIGQSLNQSVSSLISGTALLLGSTIMMFITNGILAISAICATFIGFILMGVILKKTQKYFTDYQKELGDINGYVEEMYTNHNVVKVYNNTNKVNKEFDKINESLYQNTRKSQFLSGLMGPIMGFTGNLGYVVVCVVGAILVIKGNITFGVIVAFMIYVRLFSQPLSQIAQAITILQPAAAASERVFEFLNQEELSKEEDKKYLDPKKVLGNIEFKNVKFGYDKDKLVIKNFNASVKKGQKIAIVGPTGAGKTTIVNLLMKFYEINSGDILIDNTSINDLTRENIHDIFTMILQDTWIFNGTIKENIKYNKSNITDEQIINACKTVGLHHFITTLPDGYNTIISDNETLSSGQKQLLTIARGMLENSPLLILDEATSNVDTRTEELVQKSMDKLAKNRTSFIIAHRLSTIKNADLILVIKDGNIIEQGNHAELLKKNGFYNKLYNSQFESI